MSFVFSIFFMFSMFLEQNTTINQTCFFYFPYSLCFRETKIVFKSFENVFFNPNTIPKKKGLTKLTISSLSLCRVDDSTEVD